MSKRLIFELDVPDGCEPMPQRIERNASNGKWFAVLCHDTFYGDGHIEAFFMHEGDGLTVRVVEAPEPTAQDVIDELEEWAALSTDAF